MKKLFYSFSALLCVLLTPSRSSAQCSISASAVAENHVHDTTFKLLVADTSGGTAGFTYNWVFSDGATYSGPVVRHPLTIAGAAIAYTMTATSATCASVFADGVYCNVVFNCAALQPYDFDNFTSVYQQNSFDPDDTHMNLPYFGYGDYGLRTNMHLDWGNGTLIFSSAASDSLLFIGGYADPAHTSHYRYSGEYKVSATYFYSYDTMTCPVQAIQAVSIHVGGTESRPVINGPTSYCAGDTLRLYATDTTLQFHNLLHICDTSGTAGRDYWPPYYTYTDLQSSYSFSWYDHYRNLLSTDTFLAVNNLTIFDSGAYILRIHENIMQHDTEFVVHISVGGSVIHTDSFTSPACGAGNGAIYLSCYRPNDSVVIAYKRSGTIQYYSGRTNSSGHLKISGLSDGVYTDIRAHFIGDACGSNTIPDPIILRTLPLPVVASGQISICAGGTVTLSATLSVVGASYLWTGPGGYSSTLQNPVITSIPASATGYYSVAVTAGGCSTSDFVSTFVSVLTTIPSAFTPNTPDSICLGDAVYLHTQYATWEEHTAWSSSDTSIISDWGVSVNPGAAMLIYSITNACGTDTLHRSIYVKNAPQLPAITGPALLCTGDTATFHNASPGGVWSSTTPSFAFVYIDSLTGHITNPGWESYIYIIYTKRYPNHCVVKKQAQVLVGLPVWSSYFGDIRDGLLNGSVYPGQSITLTHAVTGSYTGVWSCSPNPVATINSSGVLTGIAIGSTMLTYTTVNACGVVTKKIPAFVNDWIDTKITGDTMRYPQNDNVPAIDAYVQLPSGIAADTSGNVYILQDDAVIRKIDRNGIITTIAGRHNDFTFTGDGARSELAGIGYAFSITCDNAGNIYIAGQDFGNVIRKIDANGIISLFAGKYTIQGANYTYYGGSIPAITTAIQASRMAADNAGNLYFIDDNRRIRKVNSAGTISTIAGNGGVPYSGEGGLATAASLGSTQNLAVDRNGNLIVLSDGCLRKIDASGIITTIAGIAGGTELDTAASVMAPLFEYELTADRLGNIFCYYNHQFKKIDSNGMVTTLVASSNYPPNYYDNGPSINFYASYQGLAADNSGGIYINHGNVRREGKPQLKISASRDTICNGHSSVTFFAQGQYIGRAPSYQWQKNGINVGGDSIAYTDAALGLSDTISCKVYNAVGGLYLTKAVSTLVIQDTIIAGALTGAPIVCVGAITTLTDSNPGGTWSSSSASSASVAGGIVTGVSVGNTIIAYTKTNSCNTATDTMLITVEAPANAGTITGNATLCVDATTTLTDTTAGGTWASSSSAAGITAGIVTGISAGNSIISYSLTNSCGTATDTMMITVNPLPDAGTITGPSFVCVGAATIFANAATGGTWSSSNASMVVTGGVVTGVAAGSTTLSYNVINSCGTAATSKDITVIAVPRVDSIAGPDHACEGDVVSLTDSITGGAWSSTNTTIATIDPAGSLKALTAGTTTISYEISNNCGVATTAHAIRVVPLDDCSGVHGVFNIFPNPTESSFLVELPESDPDVMIAIMDVTGKILEVLRPNTTSKKIRVYMENLPKAVYPIKVVANGKTYVAKLVLR